MVEDVCMMAERLNASRYGARGRRFESPVPLELTPEFLQKELFNAIAFKSLNCFFVRTHLLQKISLASIVLHLIYETEYNINECINNLTKKNARKYRTSILHGFLSLSAHSLWNNYTGEVRHKEPRTINAAFSSQVQAVVQHFTNLHSIQALHPVHVLKNIATDSHCNKQKGALKISCAMD